MYTIVVHTTGGPALLDHHILPHNPPIRGHFSQLGQNAVDVLVGIDERDRDGQFASGFDEVGGMDRAASEGIKFA